MALGIKNLIEERELELLSDEEYCLRMIAEVSRFLPSKYAYQVYDTGKAYGLDLDLNDIRMVKILHKKDRTIALLINRVGQMYKKV